MLNANDFKKKQIIFLFTNEGDKLSFLNDNIIVKNKEGGIKYQSTCYRLFMICVVGNISITSGLIQRSKKFGFSICLMTTTFKVYEILGARMEGNTLLRKHQYEYTENDIGRKIEQNKIKNQSQILKNIRGKNQIMKEGIELLDKMVVQLEQQLEYLEVMGIEGNAARVYFSRVFDNVDWKGRKPRIKNDYVNVTLDIGYTMLFNIVDAILQVYGFDTYYGVFHKCFYMRKSLVCDLMEPIRPVVDYQVRKSINLGQCKENDFEVINNRWCLKYKSNPQYIQFLMNAILEYKDDIFLYIQQYYRFFMKRKIELLMGLCVILCAFVLARKGAVFVQSEQAKSAPVCIVVDAGHGGDDPGKIGINDALEKDINLQIALKLQKILEQNNIKVVMTRNTDAGLYSEGATNKKAEDMQKRCKIIEDSNALFTVSIHQNSYTSPEIQGAQVFYYGQSENGKKLAEILQTALIEQVDPDNHRAAKANESYYLLKKTPTPTVIVECGFLSNPIEAELLLQDDYQDQLVNAIYTGIKTYLGDELPQNESS